MLHKTVLMQNHLEQKNCIQAFVQGNRNEKEKIQTDCYSACILAKWLHEEAEHNKDVLNKINAVCNLCEQFMEAASQIVQFTDRGKTDLARTALQDGQLYAEASDKFQRNLENFHVGHQ
jgi:hypothetical protein